MGVLFIVNAISKLRAATVGTDPLGGNEEFAARTATPPHRHTTARRRSLLPRWRWLRGRRGSGREGGTGPRQSKHAWPGPAKQPSTGWRFSRRKNICLSPAFTVTQR